MKNESMEDIVNELLKTVKWIPDREKDSTTYNQYLDKVNEDLKEKTRKRINYE